MTFLLKDRVQEVSSTTGTGDFVLGGAPQGFSDFSAAFADGDTTWYAAVLDDAWEVGVGTYIAGTNTLERTTILASTNANAKVAFGAGLKFVFVTLPATFAQTLARLQGVETGADVTNAARVKNAILSQPQKTTLVSADRFPMLDSEASNDIVWATLANLVAKLDTYYPQTATVTSMIDAVRNSIRSYGTVRAATTANVAISTSLNAGDLIDGVTLVNGDLVLVKNQTTQSQNGVYTVASSPSRAPGFNTFDMNVGAQVVVQEGTVNADTAWLCTSNKGGVLNTDPIVYNRVNLSGELLAANNLSDLTDVAAARTVLNFENGADVTDEANVRAALANLSTNVVINKTATHRINNPDSQTVFQQFGWDAQQRWATVIEGNGDYAFYSYSADGVTIKRPLLLTASGVGVFLAGIQTASLAWLDAGGDHARYVNITSNNNDHYSMNWNFPNSSITVTWPAGSYTVAKTTDFVGKQAIPIAAAGMISPSSGGAADVTLSGTYQTYQVKAFDASSAEKVFFDMLMPESWDESTITAIIQWQHPATTTNFGVTWGVSAVAIGDDDAGDVDFGAEITVSDTGGTTNDVYLTSETAAITVAGSPQPGDLVRIMIRRIPTHGSDTMAVDAYLNQVKIFITTATGVDG